MAPQHEPQQPIVVVDHHEDTIAFIVEMLRSRGYTVEGYTNAREGLARLHRAPSSSLVILDYMMGELDGVALVQAVRATGVDVPIVLLMAAHPMNIDRGVLARL